MYIHVNSPFEFINITFVDKFKADVFANLHFGLKNFI